MKNASINLVEGFRKVTSEGGCEYFTGTLDLKALRKIGKDEIDVVLLPKDGLQESLSCLIKAGGGTPDLLMFAASATHVK